ncbi:MAG: hypothetical protein WBE34_18850 [Candidatus Nitrosopolaris sp.]
MLRAVSPCLPTHGVQPPGKAKLEQKILRFRGKEYIEQNFVVDFKCNECGTKWRPPVYTENESIKTERARKLVGIKYQNGIDTTSTTLVL